jgi:hypothetical protein
MKMLAKGSCKAIALAVLSALVVGVSANAVAETNWEKRHPRRAEVNDRLAHQNKRINRDLKEGKITPAQAHKLHSEDREIRREERAMASQNGGHITKQEQRVLHRQENAVGKQIP